MGRPPCPGCGHDACPPSCPRRMLQTSGPIPFMSEPSTVRVLPTYAAPPQHNAEKMNRVRAWQLLEIASVRWLELREHARNDGRGASQRMLAAAEQEVERAAARLRTMRKGQDT